jgi:signal transduction histidine kinase
LNAVLRSRQSDLPQQGAVPAFLIVPLALAEAVQGAMTLAFQADGPAPAETKMAEDLAVHVAAAIGRSRAHARALNALFSRDQSFAAAAHELGNPLNALYLQVHALIRTGGLETRTMARVFAMERLIKQLVDLNHRMLDTSRLSAGQFDFRLEDVDLTALVQDLLANNAEQLAWSKCPASFTSPGPVVGRWDRLRLEQVVSNLISNAIKYGFGQPISVSIEATADLAWLSVCDHGIGIAAKDHDRIFERFERASTMGGSRSLGLGLWVVRQIVGGLGGTIRVESSLGAGATFTVELPRAASTAEAG